MHVFIFHFEKNVDTSKGSLLHWKYNEKKQVIYSRNITLNFSHVSQLQCIQSHYAAFLIKKLN